MAGDASTSANERQLARQVGLNATTGSLEENAEVGNHLEEPLFHDAHLILAGAPNAAMQTPQMTHGGTVVRIVIGR